MPNNNPRTPKRSWRGDRAASPRGSAGQPAWKGERASAPGPRLSRGVKIGMALGLFLVAAVGLVAVILWFLPADPFCLVLVGADYEQNLNLDSNVAGRRGLDELATWAKASTNPKIDLRAEVRIDGPKDPVAAGLPTPDLYGRTSKTVVVFLSGDGGGDKNGAYLWLDGADPKTPGACYRVSQALDDLAKKLPEDTKKLLLLDGSHNGPSWSMGQLAQRLRPPGETGRFARGTRSKTSSSSARAMWISNRGFPRSTADHLRPLRHRGAEGSGRQGMAG